jgi:23S rRNA (adenine2503-C2)-methyltransferase
VIPAVSEDGPPRPNLFGWTKRELGEYLGRHDAAPFHAGQVYRWLYGRRRFDPHAWTDLPRRLRETIAAGSRVDPGHLAARVEATDGTVKYRAALADGRQVECVQMVQSDRVTFCVSSQVGCALDCDFCLTGRMGLVRHLTPGEIVGQVALMQEAAGLGSRPFHLVFMGMGEPLHNYDALLKALALLVDPEGFALPRRRITVSTSGLAPKIEALSREPVRPRLAVSLNATTDELRDRLMPINRAYPIARLLEACRTFARESGDRITFEYVLLGGVNDQPADLARLAALAKSVPAKVNLIPFNPVPGQLAYRRPDSGDVGAFRERLARLGVRASVRWSRGVEARAACGQLALLPGEA